MIVIGADIHKSTHALAAVSGDGGVVAGELEIRADRRQVILMRFGGRASLTRSECGR